MPVRDARMNNYGVNIVGKTAEIFGR